MKYYKWFVNKKGDTYYSKKRWKMDGSWMPYIEKLEICESGYHVITKDRLSEFLNCGPVLAEVEIRGGGKRSYDKSCFHEARVVRIVHAFTKKELVNIADYCAKLAKEYSARAADAATCAATCAAAYAAARAAARAAASAAAYAAARAAYAADAAAYAAASAAADAAADAAYAAYAAASAAAYKKISAYILKIAEEKK